MYRLRPLFHRRISATLSLLILFAASAAGQSANYPYVLKTLVGSYPLGDGGLAAQALLSGPNAVVVDSSGTLYVLDSTNYRIRKIVPGGTISTAMQLTVIATDMKLGRDGFYLAAPGLVFKVAPNGAVTPLAGNGTQGFSGDGGPAVNALVGTTGGIALDTAGNIYFCDASRIREITLDGKIKTVAGTATSGYDGDNKPAVSALLSSPTALAFDSSNNLYIADTFNYRVRMVAPNGIITTIAGNGNAGPPVNGIALATPMGVPRAIAADGAGGVFIGDVSFSEILKVGTDGTLIQVAGAQTLGYTDGPATGT
jgi:sugar lactone lactonase YvrE